MIPDQWYAILEADALGTTKPVPVVRMGERLVVWRDGEGKPVCMEDRCAHRGVALSMGTVKNGRVACAYHGFQYDNSGKCVHIPCSGEGAKIPGSLKVRHHVVKEEYGLIWLWWGEERESYPPIPWIDEVPTDHTRGITRSETWPFNYVRCVENHLDVHHWAYVHRNIMYAVGETFSDFHVDVTEDGTMIKTYGTLVRTNRHGKRGKRGWSFRAHCRLPSLNMVQVTPRFKSIIFQTPIDDETTWICVRSFQTYAQFQPFKWMIDNYCINFLFDIPLHRQDFPLFHAQRPRQSGVGVNKLVAADEGIAKYLIARERLLKAAKQRRGEEDAPKDNPRLPVVRTPLLPAEARNLTLGAESPRRQLARWLLACATYPLLIPSLLGTELLAWWDGP